MTMEPTPPSEARQEQELTWIFDLALILKGFDGLLEVVGAALVLLVSPQFIVRIAEFVTGGELATDPNDPIATAIREAAHSFAVHTHYLVALYLALHGVVKVLLVIGIFAKKRYAYPLFMFSLAIFAAYESYRGILVGGKLLLVLAAFDAMLLLLTAYEYGRRYPSTPRPDTAR